MTTDDATAERARIRAEYARRQSGIDDERYAPWNAAAALERATRVRVAAQMLKEADVFPTAATRALEIGCGRRGWIPDLLAFGVREPTISGIDLDDTRIADARASFPAAHFSVGDASSLSQQDGSVDLVVASTVFSSILSDRMRGAIAKEIERVLVPGGALLWYDFAFDNPRNRNVRGIKADAVRALFPSLKGELRRVTLAPPLARVVASVSVVAATVLEAVPLLRTHLIAVLKKVRA